MNKAVRDEFSLRLDIGLEIPLEYKNFNEIFSYIKKKLQLKNSRKTQLDSLLKKSKGKFFKTVHDIMNKCLTKLIKRLPQIFITNITIDNNLHYINKTILQIYKEFNVFPQGTLFFDDNSIKKEKKNLFEDFSSYTLKYLYEQYLESKRYKRDLNQILFTNGNRFKILYEFVSKNYYTYYLLANKETSNLNNKNKKAKRVFNKKI